VDQDEARLRAIAVLDDVLEGRMARVGELRHAWPEPGADFLLRRARQEAEHWLVTKGEVERRVVALLRRFLQTGGTPAELDRAYDEVIREALDDRPRGA
jgi:hypothetical protein